MDLSNVEWILTQDTYVRAINEADHDEDQIVMVWDSEFRHSVILRYGPRNNNPQIMALTFNGEFVDVGDELPRYLGIMDEAVENGPGEILLYQTE